MALEDAIHDLVVSLELYSPPPLPGEWTNADPYERRVSRKGNVVVKVQVSGEYCSGGLGTDPFYEGFADELEAVFSPDGKLLNERWL